MTSVFPDLVGGHWKLTLSIWSDEEMSRIGNVSRGLSPALFWPLFFRCCLCLAVALSGLFTLCAGLSFAEGPKPLMAAKAATPLDEFKIAEPANPPSEEESGWLFGARPFRWSYSNEVPRQSHFLRAALEMTAFLGAASAYYWTNEDEFARDFDFDFDGENFEDRFISGRAHRFDNNEWEVNLEHVPAGTGLYLLARSNNLNIPESFFLTAAGSFVWEAIIEMREVVSINDNIVTPFGGFAIGEVMFQMGEFFQHSPGTVPNRVLGIVFGGPTFFHRWLEGTQPRPAENYDRFCLSTDAWHRFRFNAAYGGSDPESGGDFREEMQLGMDLELINSGKYGEPGEESVFYTDGFYNQLTVQASLDTDEADVTDGQFVARTAFLGHYQQDIRKDEDSGQLNGYGLFAGASTAFEYLTHRFSDDFHEDRLLVCDLLGPALIWDVYQGGWTIRGVMDLYPNFSMVKPFAANNFKEAFNIPKRRIINSTFRTEEYYYALGLTAGSRIEFQYKPFELLTQVRYHYFDSIEGLDRFEEDLEEELNFEDERLSLLAGLGCTLPSTNLKVFVNAEKLFRWSQMEDFSADEEETRFFIGLAYEL